MWLICTLDHVTKTVTQCSKLTFSKSRLLATFKCKMVAMRKNSVAKKHKNVKGRTLHVAKKNCEGGGHFMMYYTTGQCAKRHILNTLLCCSKVTHSCRVSEWWEGKRERQMMLPLVPLIKCVLLLIITGASRRLEPVIKCCSFLSFFQCLVSRAPLSAVTESLS